MNTISQKIDNLNEGFILPEENTLAAVLQVLAITVLIDNKIHTAEPKEFIQQIKNLRIFVVNHPEFSTAQNIEQWCIDNWQNVRDYLKSSERKNYIVASFKAITCDLLQPMVYTSMNHICLCDNEMHHSEKGLLKQAAALWKLD